MSKTSKSNSKKKTKKTSNSMPDLSSSESATPSSVRSSKSINLPKIKKDVNSSSVPSPALRILTNLALIIDDPNVDGFVSVRKIGSGGSINVKEKSDGLPPKSADSMDFLDETREYQPDSNESAEEIVDLMDNLVVSQDTRRKILRHCLDLKRLMDKEGSVISSESTIQKTLFCKSGPNIVIVFKCLQASPDVDSAIVITNLLIRLVTTCESNTNNIGFMGRRSLAMVLLKNLLIYHTEFLAENKLASSSVNLAQRLDDVLVNSYNLLIKIARYDPKLPIIARLHSSIQITIDFIKKWYERKEFGPMMLALHCLRLFAARNDNNIITIQKSNLLSIMEALLKNPPPAVIVSKLDNVVELLVIIAKTKSVCLEIIQTFGTKFFLNMSTCGFDTLQRASLKFLRVLIEYDFGKLAFEAADGARLLTDALHSILNSSEGASTSLSLSNSTPAILVSVLRAAVAHSDLPFLDHYTDRSFPLPKPKEEAKPEHSDEDYIGAMDEYIGNHRGELFARLSHSNLSDIEGDPSTGLGEVMCKRLRMLCPEWDVIEGGLPSPVDAPVGNIRVRHVQPMAPGKHTVCRNIGSSDIVIEPQLRRSPIAMRKTIFEQTARMFQPANKATLVFDVMDDSVAKSANTFDGTLLFDSRFESGNLQTAVRVSQFEYDLMVQTDVNAARGRHNQWFYFSVQRMIPNAAYKFNFLNMSKPASQFNQGMQPVMYSVAEPGWKRAGDNVFYIKNHYRKSNDEVTDKDGNLADDVNSATFSTLTFVMVFKYSEDTCFIAYHFPYTYSELQRSLYQLYNNPRYRTHCRRTSLCQTLGGNECVLLTITDFDEECEIPMGDRKYVLLSGRVHPGESNSSHIMNGLIQYLLSADEGAAVLRRKCIFKIVPMINPDGVVNGSHRCSLSGIDLNRQWKHPQRLLTPTIFWTKMLWNYLHLAGKKILLSCDFHGHSRRKNMFIFGCENALSENEGLEKIFPHLLANQCNLFDYNSCRFNIERSKESTARVVLWRECNIINSFTLESSYCGADFGDKKGLQFTINDLERSGMDFAKAIGALCNTPEFSGTIPLANADLTDPIIAPLSSVIPVLVQTSSIVVSSKPKLSSSISLSSPKMRKLKGPGKKLKGRKKAPMEKRDSQASIDFGEEPEQDNQPTDDSSSSDDEGV